AQERTLFEELLGLGFSDAFHELTESSERFTWWDYRMNAFRRKLGLRIDHILMTESEFNRCAEVNILKEFRKMERPSDHAPVMATFI
ncbi:MAG: exodeoxyribonuclease III, partial [Burkholderiales bacterium]|nr:exodeoxyribonuclease III [Burkholderiales bacterium]